MKREYLSVRESDDYTTIIQTERPGYFKKLVATGAVIEQGITIRPVYNLSRILDEEKIDKNSNNRPNLPYIIGNTAYVPFEQTPEAIEIYKGIKRLSSIDDSLNIHELESLGEKIKFVYNNSFYQNEYGKTSATLKQISFYCWIICGILNTLQGKTLLYTLNYTCAVLQLDVFTLSRIVYSSSVSPEKKKYVLESLNKHGIKSEIKDERYSYGLYTKFEEEKAEEIMRKIH